MGDRRTGEGGDLGQLAGGQPFTGFEGQQQALPMFIPQGIEHLGNLLPGLRDGA